MEQPPHGMATILTQEQQNEMAAQGYYPPEDLSAGLPINLDSLRDGPPGSKPFYPYSTLIRYAIKGSPNQKLLLEDIYYAIESRFPYFRSAPSGWKNSVRHNLSLNPCFEKVARPLTDRGKGSYWTVNDNVDPRTGVHRVRKKKSKSTRGRVVTEDEQDVDYHPPEQFDEAGNVFIPNPPHPEDPNAHERTGPQPVPFPPYNFDPNFAMMNAMRFPLPGPMPIAPDEGLEVDEHGLINWRTAWHKELGHLQRVTAEQDETGGDQEWYRMMLFRIRSALMPPMMNPDGSFPVPMPPPPGVQPGPSQ